MSRRMARLERRDKRMGRIRVALLIFLGIVVLGFIYRLSMTAINAVGRFSRNIEVVQYGTMEDKAECRAIVLNKEDVVLAESNGHLENMVKDGEKIGKDTLLGYFVTTQGRTPLRAQESGTFIRETDGLEAALDSIDLQSITPEVFKYKTTRVKQDEPVMAGQPVYKIVDSLEPTRMLVHFPQDDIKFEVTVNQKVKIVMGAQELGDAVVTDMKQDFGEYLMMVKFNDFQEELLNQRFVDVQVVFESCSGYLVPEKALVDKDGEKGIYCSNGENITFKPVKIIKQKDGQYLVEGLNTNEMIVTNPPD